MRRSVSILLFAISVLLYSPGVYAALPAFPGAQGWGANALVACDRASFKVVAVTNLNDSGAGSLRAALTAAYPRIVIFKVAGNILLKSPIDVRGDLGHSCVYVAGQSAPGSGILLTADPTVPEFNMVTFQSQVHDVVFRYIKFRGNTKGNIEINGGKDIIFDHCSFSWTTNDSIDIWRADSSRGGPINNVTIQRSINSEIYDVHSTAFNIGGEHAFGYEKQVDHISLHHNLIGHDAYRNPNVTAVSIDIVNNVLYNWKYKSTIVKMGVKADVIANYYKIGPMTRIESASLTAPDRYRPIVHESTNVSLTPYPDKASLYIVENVRTPDFMDTSADNWPLLFDEALNAPVKPVFKRTPWAPLPQSPFAIAKSDPDQAYQSIVIQKEVGANTRLDCTGSRVPNSDVVDARFINDAKNGTQWFNLFDSNGHFRPPDTLAEAGGLPAVSAGSACPDSDNDGIPDAWEELHGLNKTLSDATLIHPSGYTNIESYLNATTSIINSTSVTPLISPTLFITPTPLPATTITITTTPSLCPLKPEGDANCDGLVNQSDYLVWLSEFLHSVTTMRSDFDKNNIVDLVDYVIWLVGSRK